MQDIIDLKNNIPFNSFKVTLSSGVSFSVLHPDFLFIVPSRKDMFIISTIEGRWNIVDINSITSINV